MPIKGAEILPIDPKSPDQETIKRAAAQITRGGLVVFPTSTFYGIGAQALNAHAVDRVFQVKERHRGKPLLVLIASLTDLAPLVQSIPETAVGLIQAFWPGGITLVFDAADAVPPNLTGHTGKIGVRLASHPVAAALVEVVSGPITGTSANLSGEGGCIAVNGLNGRIKDQVDLALDAGRLAGVRGSTVVDVTTTPPRILREGVISSDRIRGLFDNAS
ncbi:MAG: L-threonylcarbamoyladenylate synthase [Thermodesulfobacteriota bacterium]|nr:L-threonylcarbamoyladenylate synthase [Thermodesulfobacteriota bacterium]